MDFTDPTASVAQDPDLAAVAAGVEPSDYDELDDELAELDTPTVDLEVPRRPGYALRCRTDFTSRDIDLLLKRCRDKRFATGSDSVKYAALLLGLTCIAVLRHGEPLELDGTSPITLTSSELWAKLDTSSADETARKLYGVEGHVDAAGNRLMAEAGWGDDVYATDPTK